MQIQGFKKLPVIGGQEVDICFEYSSELIFVHLVEVRDLNRRSIEEIMFLIEEWGPFLRNAGYPAVFGLLPDDNKTVLKLAKRLGFVIHGRKDQYLIVRLDLGET